MRTIAFESVVEAAASLCEQTLFHLREDVELAIQDALPAEQNASQQYLSMLLQNAELARKEKLPITQDAGLPVFFVEQGEDVSIENGDVGDAIQQGIQKSQQQNPFPTQMAQEPFSTVREPTSRLRPILHKSKGEPSTFKIQCLRTDARSEINTLITHLPYPYTKEQLFSLILNHIETQAFSAIPPLLVGIGLGGTLSEVGVLARKALLRPVGKPHQELDYALMEQHLQSAINESGFGPGGLGGRMTALTVHIETASHHQNLLPVCIYLQSYHLRSGELTL